MQMAVLITSRASEAFTGERRSQLQAQLEDEDVAVAQAAHQTFFQATQKIIGYNDKLIELSILERNNHARLAQVPGYDARPDAVAAFGALDAAGPEVCPVESPGGRVAAQAAAPGGI